MPPSPESPVKIDLSSHKLHVLRVDADLIVAEVVNLEPLGDVPFECEPGGSVRPGLALPPELAPGHY